MSDIDVRPVTTVYVLEIGAYEECGIEGVYSSVEAAQQADPDLMPWQRHTDRQWFSESEWTAEIRAFDVDPPENWNARVETDDVGYGPFA